MFLLVPVCVCVFECMYVCAGHVCVCVHACVSGYLWPCVVVGICGLQDGLTALHCAAIGGQEEAVKMLVQEFKLDPDIPDVVSNAKRHSLSQVPFSTLVTQIGAV